MSTLTEQEIGDCLRTNIREAVQYCVNLAKLPAQGPTYRKLVDNLKLIEGASRQMGHFREDMRWMRFGWEMARFHQRIGDAVRSRAAREIFLAMSVKLKDALAECDKLRTEKTGRRGAILPILRPVHRETRPVHISAPAYIRNPSGLVIPESAIHGRA